MNKTNKDKYYITVSFQKEGEVKLGRRFDASIEELNHGHISDFVKMMFESLRREYFKEMSENTKLNLKVEEDND